MSFDPNLAVKEGSNIFGFPYTKEKSSIVLIPLPWEATTSYGNGTSKAPNAILKASYQVDLFDVDLGLFFEKGIAMAAQSTEIEKWNKEAMKAAEPIIKNAGYIEGDDHLKPSLDKVNELSEKLNEHMYNETKQLLDEGKTVGTIGGDHSCVFGSIKAHLEKYPNMGILQFDAHADLREAFEGFTYSHASIMYNVMQDLPLKKLVQVGVRDFCQEEKKYMDANTKYVTTFFDQHLAEAMFTGKSWDTLCEEIVNTLPKEVYISFDIDGLDPKLCPHTGTPVPGGMDFAQMSHLLKKIVRSDRKIIGFDLVEVAPDPDDEWDAAIGARILFKLCGWTMESLT